MRVTIYQPAKTAMQSGIANAKNWVLAFDVGATRFVDPLMGWSGSSDTQEQLTLRFGSKEEAVAYATQKGYQIELHDPNARVIKPKSYSANFATNTVHYADEADAF